MNPGRLGRQMALLVTATLTYIIVPLNAMAVSPYLVECFCSTTVKSQVTVSTTEDSQDSQIQLLVMPGCVEDVFATTGIRWYMNGPFDPSITYWPTTSEANYTGDRAAMRLFQFGYICRKTQLGDASKLLGR